MPSSTLLPVAEPSPDASTREVLVPPLKNFASLVTALNIFACGVKNVKAPTNGPVIPAKSPKSPCLKPNEFSSIMIFC